MRNSIAITIAFVSLTQLASCGAATHDVEHSPRPCLSDADCRGQDRICHQDRCRFAEEVRRELSAHHDVDSATNAVVETQSPTQPADAGIVPTQVSTAAIGPDMFMGDARHTGRSPYVGPRATPSIAFTHSVGGRIYGAPVRTPNGLVVVASTDRSVVGIEDAGDHATVRFRYVGADRFQASPLVLSNGDVVVAGHDGNLVALGDRGQLRWQRQLGAPLDASPTLSLGSIWTTADGVVSIAENGSLRARVPFAGVRTSVSVRDDGEACAASIGGAVACFSRDGVQRFRTEIGASSDSAPAIGDDGTLYIGNDAGVLFAIALDGSVRFRVETGGAIRTTPAIGLDGTIYFGSDDRVFYGVSAAGEIRFRVQTGGRIRSSARVDAAGNVFFGSQDDFLYALRANGELLYRVQLAANVDSTPCLAPGGVLYVGTDAGTLVALKNS